MSPVTDRAFLCLTFAKPMVKKNWFWMFLGCTCLLVSCEKDIEIKLNETTPRLVVDASIENGRPPLVILSKSLDYFGKISPELLLSSFVRKANVSISVNGQTYSLREDSIKMDSSRLYFYSNFALIGKLETSYTLTITTDGQTYTAKTTIPAITRKIDSLWWQRAIVSNDTGYYARLMIKATDKPGYGDYIRYYTSRNREGFFPGFNSVFDDQVIDGKSYVVGVDRGVNKNSTFKEEDLYFKKGDTATLKLCNIDKATYDFWRTFEFNYQSIGNPFSSPIKVLGNVSGNALGYFGGYAAQYRTLIIPK